MLAYGRRSPRDMSDSDRVNIPHTPNDTELLLKGTEITTGPFDEEHTLSHDSFMFDHEVLWWMISPSFRAFLRCWWRCCFSAFGGGFLSRCRDRRSS